MLKHQINGAKIWPFKKYHVVFMYSIIYVNVTKKRTRSFIQSIIWRSTNIKTVLIAVTQSLILEEILLLEFANARY